MSEVRIPPSLRRRVATRAQHRCEYCRAPGAFSSGPFCVDHIEPSSRGGESHADNLALSCAGCNGYKLDYTSAPDPLTGRTVRLFHPRRDPWELHFLWSDDSLTLLPLSRIGRATISLLRMNRPELKNLRRALILLDEHPPD